MGPGWKRNVPDRSEDMPALDPASLRFVWRHVMSRPTEDDVIVIRDSGRRHGSMAAASIGFVLVEGLMLMAPQPESALLPKRGAQRAGAATGTHHWRHAHLVRAGALADNLGQNPGRAPRAPRRALTSVRAVSAKHPGFGVRARALSPLSI